MSVMLMLLALRGGNGAPAPRSELQIEPTKAVGDEGASEVDFGSVAAKVAADPPPSRWMYRQTTASERSGARLARNMDMLSRPGDQNKEDFDRVAELVASHPPPSRWYGTRPRAERTNARLDRNIANLEEARGA